VASSAGIAPQRPKNLPASDSAVNQRCSGLYGIIGVDIQPGVSGYESTGGIRSGVFHVGSPDQSEEFGVDLVVTEPGGWTGITHLHVSATSAAQARKALVALARTFEPVVDRGSRCSVRN